MGSELRSGDVTTAAESITMYARYCELRADGRVRAEAANVLKEIEDYNLYDCRSTHQLRDWLIRSRHSSPVCRRWARSPSPTAIASRTP